jgi:hypothetical protein
MRLNRRIVVPALFAFALLITGCAPEGERERGGGPGADSGNHGDSINMHGEGSAVDRIYYETPSMGRGIERRDHAGAVTTGS